MGIRHLAAALLAGGFVTLSACGSGSGDVASESTAAPPPVPSTLGSVTLVTHDSFSLSEAVLAEFTDQTGYTVRILAPGDAGSMLNQSILTAGDPLGDVIFGVDTTFLSRALQAEVTIAYESPMLDEIPDHLELDSSHRLLPVDVGDVCLNYDVGWFEDAGLAAPSSLADLAKPDYADLLVVQNPATSSPGLAFLLATVAEFGVDDEYDWLDFWSDLRSNGVSVQPGWTEAYTVEFTIAGGDRPIVVSYATSPPAEVFFADPRPDTAPTAVVEASCFRQQEFVGILRGTDNLEGARALVDFLLSRTAQEDIPWNMFVFPVNETAQVPDEFVQYSSVPTDPLSVPAEQIEQNRETWIEQWTETVIG